MWSKTLMLRLKARHKQVWILTAAAISFGGWTGPLWADAIPGPPENCPAGSRGTSSHCGEDCVPLPCSSDSDCKDKTICRKTRLCIRQAKCAVSSGRGAGDEPQKMISYEAVHGKCPAGDKCAQGACVEAKRCVHRFWSCQGCQLAGPNGAWPVFLALALLLVGVRRRFG